MKHLIMTILVLLLSLLLVIPVLALTLPIWLFVFSCRLVNRALEGTVTDWSAIIQYDPVIGWKPRASLNNVKYADPVGDTGTISTDGSGWPLDFPMAQSDIVVFGDSFAFGFGARMEDAYFSVDPGLRIKPVAAPSYNMVQALLLMREHRAELGGKLIFWFVCLENDLVENLKPYNSKNYTNPFLKNNGDMNRWEIQSGHLQPKQWLYRQSADNTLCFADICTKSPYAGRVQSGLEYLIGQARAVCEAAGSQLVIFTIPDKRQLTAEGIDMLKARLHESAEFDEDYPDEIMGKVCGRLGVPVIRGKARLSIDDYKPRDPHWNEKGNRRVGQIICDYYRRQYSRSYASWADSIN